MTTIRIKLPKINEVEFKIKPLVEYANIRGNYMASGDADFDKKCEDEIIEKLDNGNEWAWCCVEVTTYYKGIKTADYLGCCSYNDEQDFKDGGYYEDMKQTAYDDLINRIKALSSK